MMKAAAPMTGGISCPPVDAVASVAAANDGRNPARFIIGMVNDPDATVLATELPETIPCIPLAAMAALAGPPANLPVARNARSLKNAPMLVLINKTPKSRNKKMNVDDTWIGVPKMARLEKNTSVAYESQSYPACEKIGICGPKMP